jgi:hypothetical protein
MSSIHVILPVALDPVVYSASNRNESHKIFLGNIAQLALKDDNLTALNRLSRESTASHEPTGLQTRLQ